MFLYASSQEEEEEHFATFVTDQICSDNTEIHGKQKCFLPPLLPITKSAVMSH